VAGGSHFLATAVFGLGRVNADGTLDAAFGARPTYQKARILLVLVSGSEQAAVGLIGDRRQVLARDDRLVKPSHRPAQIA
jgi:hypothetical protein